MVHRNNFTIKETIGGTFEAKLKCSLTSYTITLFVVRALINRIIETNERHCTLMMIA